MPPVDPANLRKAMDKAGFSTKRLAEESGLSLQYVCDLTSGHRNLKRNPELRRKLAAILDVPVHWIERQRTDEVA